MPSSFHSPNFSPGFPEQGYGLQCANSLRSHGRIRAGVVSLTGLLFMYTFSRCREACLQLHEDAKNLLKHQLNQEHEEIVRALKYVPQENNYSLHIWRVFNTVLFTNTDTVLGFVSWKKKTCKNKTKKQAKHTIEWSDQKNQRRKVFFFAHCRKELEDNGEELLRIKECYVQLSEESRVLEQRLKEEFDNEKDTLLAEVTIVNNVRTLCTTYAYTRHQHDRVVGSK